MNRLKKLFISAVAILLSLVCVFGLTACGEDIDEVDIKIAMYNFEDEEVEDYSFEIELYRHLAPKTVDAISKYLKDGYYNGAVFYKHVDYASQIMIGDLMYDPTKTDVNEGFYLNDKKPNLSGEFKYGGTVGSNLKNQKGSIGLWRTWSTQDSNYNQGSTGMSTGSATWFIPIRDLTNYDDYFCVFAQYDVNNSDNKETIDALNKLFSTNVYYQSYMIYYTGEYGTNGESLVFNCVKKDDFNPNDESIFKAKENSKEYVCYNAYEIQVPMNSDGEVAAKIVSAKVK